MDFSRHGAQLSVGQPSSQSATDSEDTEALCLEMDDLTSKFSKAESYSTTPKSVETYSTQSVKDALNSHDDILRVAFDVWISIKHDLKILATN